MFALPFNFPFRKNDGSLSTIGAEISGGGGGGYELPTATASRLGGVKVGANLSVTDDGTLSAPTPTPAYELPTASANTLGGVKIGDGLNIDENGVISINGIPMTKIWENESPTSIMGATEIELTKSELFLIVFRYSTGSPVVYVGEYYNPNYTKTFNHVNNDTVTQNFKLYTRKIEPTSTGIKVSAGTVLQFNSSGVGSCDVTNGYLIPYQIYSI